MKCRAARELFDGRLDDGLSYAEQRLLKDHLQTCPACTAEFRRLSATVRLLRDLPEVEPSPTFLQDVLRMARQSEPALDRATIERAGWLSRMAASLRIPALGQSRPWAVAYIALGLAIGIGGSSVLKTWMRGPAVAVGTRAATSAAETTDGSTPLPASPFKDLVETMIAAETPNVAETPDSSGVQAPPDWRTDWSQLGGIQDQQVNASPSNRRPAGSGSGGAYVVF